MFALCARSLHIDWNTNTHTADAHTRTPPPRGQKQDDSFDDYAVPAGSDLFISVWNLHRDPKLWERATEFDPDRWGACGRRRAHTH